MKSSSAIPGRSGAKKSALPKQFRNGYYDEHGYWRRTKFCTVPCSQCDCSAPGGVWQLPNPKKENKKEDGNKAATS